MQAVTVKEGAGAGVWIGIFGILLLLGGAGLWFYTTRMRNATTEPTVQVAAAPTPDPTPAAPTPLPTPTPETSTLVPAPTPNPTTEVIPQNPDLAQKQPPPPPTQPPSKPAIQTRPAPTPAPAVKATRQTSGSLHAAVEVAQNGEVVFENLPGARLRFTFDHSAWRPTISRQANGTQTLIMRSLKPGIQTTCDVKWEIVE